MEKVYKSKIYRILINLVMGVAAGGLAYFIATIWLDQFVSMAIGAGIFLGYVWLVILGNLITITVKDGYLTVQQGRKSKSFKIAECSFHAKVTRSSSDTTCELTVIDANGKTEYIDCELIGFGQFQELLEDLGVIGQDVPVYKIQTKKGE